jgi:hypothetical protein
LREGEEGTEAPEGKHTYTPYTGTHGSGKQVYRRRMVIPHPWLGVMKIHRTGRQGASRDPRLNPPGIIPNSRDMLDTAPPNNYFAIFRIFPPLI